MFLGMRRPLFFLPAMAALRYVSAPRILVVFWCMAGLALGAHAQGKDGFPQRGEAAIAERYAAWAERAIAEERWAEAEQALERAADYADVSSDLSYLLALVRSRRNYPQREILEALGRALEANRWNRHNPEAARFLEAQCLIHIRAFDDALRSLAEAGENADTACLRLIALRFLPDIPRFREFLAQTMERYPQDPRPVGILFTYAADRLPQGNEMSLIETALRRLPLLLETDPELAYGALPFIRDTAAARRLMDAYRAMGGKAKAAIPWALNLGVIEDDQAIAELFAAPASVPGNVTPSEPVLDKALLLSVWGLLRGPDARARFNWNLSRFSGVITEDRDRDGIPESETRYREGLILNYTCDADQDGVWDLQITFSAGFPHRGAIAASREPGGGRSLAAFLWEQYPSLRRVEFDGVTYIPRPREFSFAPIRFSGLTGDSPGALLYPEVELPLPRLTRRTLISYAHTIERPSAEFKGAIERVELSQGIPLRATEWLGSQLISVTEFVAGRPHIQRVDLDMDGRMETIRRFRHDWPVPDTTGAGERFAFFLPDYVRALESSESDWDGDGVYETGETYLPDGGTARSWDMDRDGVKDYTEIEEGN